MVVSTLTADPLETVAAEFGDTPGFFQLYTPTDRELAASLVSRAEPAGFKAHRRHARHLDHRAGGHATCRSATSRSCAATA